LQDKRWGKENLKSGGRIIGTKYYFYSVSLGCFILYLRVLAIFKSFIIFLFFLGFYLTILKK